MEALTIGAFTYSLKTLLLPESAQLENVLI